MRQSIMLDMCLGWASGAANEESSASRRAKERSSKRRAVLWRAFATYLPNPWLAPVGLPGVRLKASVSE